ncbi:hypothetical protein ACQJBY_009392 [Aegilops geniculata]
MPRSHLLPAGSGRRPAPYLLPGAAPHPTFFPAPPGRHLPYPRRRTPPHSPAPPDAAWLPRAAGRRLPPPRHQTTPPFPTSPVAVSFPCPTRRCLLPRSRRRPQQTGTVAVAPHQIHELLSLHRRVHAVQRCNHKPFNLSVVDTPLHLLVATHPGVARPLGSPPLQSAVQPGRPRPFTVAAPRPTVLSHLPPAPWAPVCVPYPSRCTRPCPPFPCVVLLTLNYIGYSFYLKFTFCVLFSS